MVPLLARSPHHAVFMAILLFSGASLTYGTASHPRLLLQREELPRIRHACGVGAAEAAAPDWGRHGRHATDYQALRDALMSSDESGVLPGEVLAAAFLHVVEPDDPRDGERLKLVSRALEEVVWTSEDALEAVLALDWCWDALPEELREKVLYDVRQHIEPFTSEDSPLLPRRFRQRLTYLALALAVDEDDQPSPSWVTVRERVLEAAEMYFERTFPRFLAWRGFAPTGAAAGPREESDTALALEFASVMSEQDIWGRHGADVGRWLEHYVYETVPHPALDYNILHDDGNVAPTLSIGTWSGLQPVTAHLLAVRTKDPAAAYVAERVTRAIKDNRHPLLAVLWRWVPIAFERSDVSVCDTQQLPPARNLQGTIIFRAGQGPFTSVVRVDAGQPFLRRRQHFDAGHFHVRHGGDLTPMSGDDVLFLATAGRGGGQYLGSDKQPFEFEQFFTATISHNAIVRWDPTHLERWYGQRYLPVGGQRLVEDTCTDFGRPLAAQRRTTGSLVAYGTHRDAAYCAIDLTAAYDHDTLLHWTRELVFCEQRILIVVDRVRTARGRNVPTWILQIPIRPEVDGQNLAAAVRITEATESGGIWRVDGAAWLRWTDRDGALWLTTPLPSPQALRLVGGPGESLRVPAGPDAGRKYIGGAPAGFSRLIIPGERHGARNAWYRLGNPGSVGSAFGKVSHWGRLELEPLLEQGEWVTFATALVMDEARNTEPPTVELEHVPPTTQDASGTRAHRTIDYRLHLRAREATIRFAFAERTLGGVLECGQEPTHTWRLPQQVEPDDPLPTVEGETR